MPSKKPLSASPTDAPAGSASSPPPSIEGSSSPPGINGGGGGADPPDGLDAQGSGEFNARAARPAWKMPLIGAGRDSAAAEPVMGGAVSWPALADARGTKALDVAKSARTPPAIEVLPVQRSGAGTAWSRGAGNDAGGSGSGDNVAIDSRQKMLPKRGTSNVMPAFSATSTPGPSPRFDNAIPVAMHPVAEAVPSDHTVKGSEVGMKLGPFHQRVEGGGAYTSNSVNRRNNMREQGRGNHVWHLNNNRGYINGRDNGMAIQHQRVGPRNLPRPGPALISANPGFINPASFQAGRMYFMPAPDPLHSAAYFPPGPPVLIPGPDPASLRAMLVKQIEYYFSIENLCRDIYLRSNMDAQGFIPVSVIANFNRVRALTPSPALILQSLHNSVIVEVQGDKLRKRDDWANWLLPSSHYVPSLATPLPAAKRESVRASVQYRADLKPGVVRNEQKKVGDNNHGHSGGASVRGSGVGSERQLSIKCCKGFTCVNVSAPVQDELPTMKIGFLLQVSEHMGVNDNAQVADAINHGAHGARIHSVEVHTGSNSFSVQTEGSTMTGHGAGNSWLHALPADGLIPVRAGGESSEFRTAEPKKGGLSAACEARNSAHPPDEDTFQLDEELGTEHSVCQDPCSQYKSCNNEDEDDSEVNDQDVQRLIIITQMPPLQGELWMTQQEARW